MIDQTTANAKTRKWMELLNIDNEMVGLSLPQWSGEHWSVRVYYKHTGRTLGFVLLDKLGAVNAAASWPNTKG